MPALDLCAGVRADSLELKRANIRQRQALMDISERQHKDTLAALQRLAAPTTGQGRAAPAAAPAGLTITQVTARTGRALLHQPRKRAASARRAPALLACVTHAAAHLACKCCAFALQAPHGERAWLKGLARRARRGRTPTWRPRRSCAPCTPSQRTS